MVRYILDLQMAKKDFEITDRMMELISSFAEAATNTIVSKRNKRSFSVLERIDKYTLRVQIESRTSINPTRTMSTLTRAATQNEEFYLLVKDNLYNGLIFSTSLISTENAQIIQMADTEIVSEIINIFFKNSYLPSEKELVEDTAEKIREIIIEYKNLEAK